MQCSIMQCLITIAVNSMDISSAHATEDLEHFDVICPTNKRCPPFFIGNINKCSSFLNQVLDNGMMSFGRSCMQRCHIMRILGVDIDTKSCLLHHCIIITNPTSFNNVHLSSSVLMEAKKSLEQSVESCWSACHPRE